MMPVSRFLAMALALSGLGLLSGCPQSVIPPSALPQTSLAINTSSRPSPEQASQQVVTFGVQWPDRTTQVIPVDTQAVTFFVQQNGALVTQVTIIKDPAIPHPTKTVKLYPGDYIVQVRAYATAIPVDGVTPMLASGAASFTVTQGKDSEVAVTLIVNSSGSPGDPIATPSPSAPPTQEPTPTPSPLDPSGGTGISLTIE